MKVPKRPAIRVDVLTLFPKMFEGPFSESLLGKAQARGFVDLRVHDLRSFTTDRHRTMDARPYGGGPGMVMLAEPIFRALRSLGVPARKRKNRGPTVVFLSPQGKPLTQNRAAGLSKKKRLILLCGHYEGIDERLFSWIDEEISVGDVVYTGGEIPAMAVTDAVVRLVPGVVQRQDSLTWDSFGSGWQGRLDCPHYTRPDRWRNQRVPEVLLGGNHRDIQEWREQAALRSTKRKRPDLLIKRHN